MGKLYTETQKGGLQLGLRDTSTRVNSKLFATGHTRSHVNEVLKVLGIKHAEKEDMSVGTFVGDGVILKHTEQCRARISLNQAWTRRLKRKHGL